jgi:ketosteroid isomerase-like protein
MSATDAVAVVERFGAAFGAQDLAAVMAMTTPDCVFDGTVPPLGRRYAGQAEVREAWREFFASSPSASFETEEIVGLGDRVVVRWLYRWDGGQVRGIDLFTIRDGLVAEKLSYVKG